MSRVIIFLLIVIAIAVGAYVVTQKPARKTEQPATNSEAAAEKKVETKDSETLTGDFKVTVNEYPREVEAGSIVSFKWTVTTPEPTTTSHTSIHYDTKSHAGVLGLDVTPALSGYANLIGDFAKGSFQAPNSFTANLTTPRAAGTLYFRAHAMLDGKHYWSEEMSIVLKAAATVAPAPEPASQPTPPPTPSY